MKQITNRKAISPIIATLLLILIAIAAGVVVYAYVIGFVGNSTTGQGLGNTQLSADQVAIKASTGVTTLVLKNAGGTTAVLSSGLYLKGGTLSAVTQQGWLVTITTSSGTPASITDIQVSESSDTGHVTVTIATSASTVAYTVTFLSSGLSCTITNPTTTGSCGTAIALPTGVTVSTSFVADSGTINITPGATATNVGVSTAKGSGAGTLSLSPSATAETDLFAIGATKTSLTAGNIYTVQVTTNDGSSFVFNARAS